MVRFTNREVLEMNLVRRNFRQIEYFLDLSFPKGIPTLMRAYEIKGEFLGGYDLEEVTRKSRFRTLDENFGSLRLRPGRDYKFKSI